MNGDIFETQPLFKDLNESQVALLRDLFVLCDIYANDKIFAQDAPAEYLYIVITGEVVVVYKPYDGPPIVVARVQPGGVVGWSAALGSRSYTSGAETSVCSQLLRVRGADLRALCLQYPDLGEILLERLATLIAERLRNTHPQVLALLRIGLKTSAPAYHQEI